MLKKKKNLKVPNDEKKMGEAISLGLVVLLGRKNILFLALVSLIGFEFKCQI